MEQVKIFRWRQPYGDNSIGASSGNNESSWEEFEKSVNAWLAKRRPQITQRVHADYDHGHTVAIYYRTKVPAAKGERKAA
ncbi:MAG: hypothetical protein Q7R80_00165 [bacterium]|nr:hypothetical protein [bacterium]